MGRVIGPGSEVQKFLSGVQKLENFASGVDEISKKFGAKFEFSKKVRSKIDILPKKVNITNNSLKVGDFHTFYLKMLVF